jgi:hypothetical protein
VKVARVLLGPIASAAGVVLFAGCGDVYADPDGTLVAVDAEADVVFIDAGSAIFPQDTVPRCPDERPRENSRCSPAGSTCEYGPSPDRECNDILACSGMPQSWESRPSDLCFASICPVAADVASLEGKPCELEIAADAGPITDNDEAVCNMTDGVCACTTGPNAASKHERKWVCVRPLSVCPTNRPRLGAPCSGGLWCDYGSCLFKRGLTMECSNGLWLTGGESCE